MRILPYRTGFQSTLPQRERRMGIYNIPLMVLFQSTLPQRERHQGTTAVLGYWNFNPRSRKGSDRRTLSGSFRFWDFNPRSRKGSDPGDRTFSVHPYYISIHAPAKGATPEPAPFQCIRIIFQSTLPQRERLPPSPACPVHRKYFNPRSRKGSDGARKGAAFLCFLFQSTLPQRERQIDEMIDNALQ